MTQPTAPLLGPQEEDQVFIRIPVSALPSLPPTTQIYYSPSQPLYSKGGKAFSYEPNYSGPVKNRSCTDVCCLIIFILFILIWCVLFFFALRYADPRLLVFPQDYKGRYCGLSQGVDKKPYLFYFDLLECDPVKVNFVKCQSKYICVEECPKYTFSVDMVINGENFGGITAANYKDYLICEGNVTDYNKAIQNDICAKIYMKSQPVLQRCIPKLEAFNTSMIDEIYKENNKLNPMNQLMRILNSLSYYHSIPEKIVADFNAAKIPLLVALLLSMVICLIWIVFMGWYTALVVWASIFGIYAFLIFGIYSCYTNYVQLNQPPLNCSYDISLQNQSVGSKCSMWKYGGIGLLVGTIILSLILFYVRNKIRLAIELIREASSSVLAYSMVLVYPMMPFVLEVGVFFLCGFFSLNVVSLGATEHKPNATGYLFIRDFCENSSYGRATLPDYQHYGTYETNIVCSLLKVAGNWVITTLNLYNLFGLLWAVSFLKGLNHLVLAGVFATYYWTFRKPEDLPLMALPSSLYRAVRYHLGSIALGGFLISITKYFRLMLEYIYRSTRGSDNPISKLVVKACGCCLWIFEKFVKFISKNSYIMIASFGYNFCHGASEAFLLLLRNVVRVLVLNKITDLVLFLGKMKIVLLMGILSYFYFSGKIVEDVPAVHYLASPIVIICICSYIVSTIFFQVFHVAVDTLFLCFLEDCERNDGTPEKPYFMSRKLMKLLGKSNLLRQSDGYSATPSR